MAADMCCSRTLLRYAAPYICQAAIRVIQLIAARSDGACVCRRPSPLTGQPAARSTASGPAKCLPVLCAGQTAAYQPACVGTAGARLLRAPPPLLAPLPGEEAWLHPPVSDVPLGRGAPQPAGDSVSALLAAALHAPLLPAEQQKVRLVPPVLRGAGCQRTAADGRNLQLGPKAAGAGCC